MHVQELLRPFYVRRIVFCGRHFDFIVSRLLFPGFEQSGFKPFRQKGYWLFRVNCKVPFCRRQVYISPDASDVNAWTQAVVRGCRASRLAYKIQMEPVRFGANGVGVHPLGIVFFAQILERLDAVHAVFHVKINDDQAGFSGVERPCGCFETRLPFGPLVWVV